jgi:hypothetical protein
MTRNDDFTAQLEGYLEEYEGSTPLPGHVRDAIRAQLPSIRQRSAWWPARRFPEMNQSMRIALASAAVVAVALIGIIFLRGQVGGPSVGGPSPASPPTPRPTPPVLSGEALEAGTYQLTVLGVVDATITVPDGWHNIQGFGVGKESNPDSYAAVVLWPSDTEVAHVYADPCHWQDGYVDPPVGPSVDDLATALANQPQRGESAPVDVSIDGYPGKMIELSVPDDINFADCDGGQFYSWEGRFHQAPGQIDRIYILDVGGQRLVIDANFIPGTLEADLAEHQAVVDSIQLEGP